MLSMWDWACGIRTAVVETPASCLDAAERLCFNSSHSHETSPLNFALQIEDALKLLPGPHFEATQQDDEEVRSHPSAAASGGICNIRPHLGACTPG